MITRNKIVLGIDTKLLHEVKYEAIESVSNIRDLESCWGRNGSSCYSNKKIKEKLIFKLHLLT